MADDKVTAIVGGIIGEAEEKAKKTLENAETYRAEKITEAEKRAAKIKEEGMAAAKTDAENLVSRRRTLARIETRKTMTEAKQKAIDGVYEKAAEKLSKMDRESYLAFIEKLAVKYAEEGETIVISALSPIGEEEVKALPVVKERSLFVKGGGKFDGGIVIEGKACDKDLSFASIVDELKESTEADVAISLFGRSE